MSSITDNKYNLTMWQGSTFSFEIIVNDSEDKPENLTGFIARMQIRPSYKSSTIIESLSSSTGEITIDGTSGKLSVALSAARTAAAAAVFGNNMTTSSDAIVKPVALYVVVAAARVIVPAPLNEFAPE